MKTPTIEDLARWARIAGRVGSVLVQIRGRPQPRDWLALGLSTVDIAMEVQAERAKVQAARPIFPPNWFRLPLEWSELISPHVQGRAERIDRIGDFTVLRTYVNGAELRWVKPADSAHPPSNVAYFAPIVRAEETYDALRTCIWSTLRTQRAEYIAGALRPSAPIVPHVQTDFIRSLHARAEAWLNAGIMQSILLLGRPGSGKSLALQSIAEKLGLRTLQLDHLAITHPGTIHGRVNGANEAELVGTHALVQMLQPDILILDDVDRISDKTALLAFLEWVRSRCRLLFATANHRQWLLDDVLGEGTTLADSAYLRPGRLDEHITPPLLSAATVRALVGEDEPEDFLFQVREWPICFLQLYATRKKVFGREAAQQDVPEIARRATLDEALALTPSTHPNKRINGTQSAIAQPSL